MAQPRGSTAARRRVVHVGTGMTGSVALRAIIDDPALDLVGVKVSSPGKIGADAGQLCGRPDVHEFSVGDDVFGMIRFPSFGDSAAYAEYVAAPASDLAHKPAGIDHVHAAAAPMSGLTAWQFLIDLGHDETNPLQPQAHRPVPLDGMTVLVNGAAGGVGHIAVQLAKYEGAQVALPARNKAWRRVVSSIPRLFRRRDGCGAPHHRLDDPGSLQRFTARRAWAPA